MTELVTSLGGVKALPFLRAALLLLTGFLLAKISARLIVKGINNRLKANQILMLRRFVFYFIFILFTAMALREMGFSLATLLGAAGIFSVAIGFAARTAIANFISGLFVMTEQPFQIGDTIKIGRTQGEILSIDLLSIKLRTADNQYVRIPNENILKTETTTTTRFAIRRAEILLSVSYSEDLRKIRRLLEQIALTHPLALIEPEPDFTFETFGQRSLDIKFTVWTKRQNLGKLKNELKFKIKDLFEQEGIKFSAQDPVMPLTLTETPASRDSRD